MKYTQDDIKTMIANRYVCDDELALTALSDQIHTVLCAQAERLGELTDIQITRLINAEIDIFLSIEDHGL